MEAGASFIDGAIHFLDGNQTVSDYWDDSMKHMPIMVLEGYALLRVLESVRKHIKSSRINAYVDNQVLINALSIQGCRYKELKALLKDLFQFTLEHDIHWHLIYVPSKVNPVVAPSREYKKSHTMLTKKAWETVQEYYGGDRDTPWIYGA